MTTTTGYDPLTGTNIASRQCEIAACTNHGAVARSASGIVYACPSCWEPIEQDTSRHLAEQPEQDAYDQHIARDEAELDAFDEAQYWAEKADLNDLDDREMDDEPAEVDA